MKEFVEKLMERLEEYTEYDTFDIYKEEPLINISFETLDDIVKQLAEEYNNGWIPVEKTLPKKSGYYTVTEEQYSLDMRKKMGVRVSHEVQFDAEEQRWHRAKFLKVIAWKEHETPYQPKGENDGR